MQSPLVSICIPTYNGEKYIAEAMDSAINQTYTNLEIIVSDDASKDNTLKIVECYCSKTDIPVSIYNHKPQGIGANWNNCVRKAKGEYIKFLFQDDVLLPNCVEQMVRLARSNNNVGLVYSKREIIYNSEKTFDLNWVKKFSNLHTYWQDLQIEEGVLPGKTYLKDSGFLNYPLNKIGEPPAVLIHKEVFNKIGYFHTKLHQELDFEYWYRLMPYFKVGFVDQPLIKFRLHCEQATQVNKSTTTKDSTLLPIILFKNIFKYLHRSQQKKLLKITAKNTLLYKVYVRIRNKIKI